MKKNKIFAITEEYLDRIREIFGFSPCKLNCNYECLRSFVSLSKEKGGFGILRPFLINTNQKRECYFFEILKEPCQKETISETERLLNFHCSTLIYKILEVQRIVMEKPSENGNLKDLAFEIALNPSYLSLKFKEISGISLKEYVKKIKLCKSLWEVISTDKPIKLIAREYGYTHEAFTRIFKMVFGLSPNSVRKRLHELLK